MNCRFVPLPYEGDPPGTVALFRLDLIERIVGRPWHANVRVVKAVESTPVLRGLDPAKADREKWRLDSEDRRREKIAAGPRKAYPSEVKRRDEAAERRARQAKDGTLPKRGRPKRTRSPDDGPWDP